MSRNIALVGCGAIAQIFYLPALAKFRSEFDRIWLVDPSDHALTVAARMVQGKTARSLSKVDDEVQYVIIATPNSLHFSMAREGLSRNAHVLIEKPFAIWPEEGRELATCAAASNRIIAINQTRRFYPNTHELRQRIGAGEFGALQSVVHHEGVKLSWPFESGAAFAKNAQRTGVIMDFGVHVIDFYQYVLQAKWTFVAATHDGFCGPEGLAEIRLEANGAPVSIRLSRYHSQQNVARLSFENAEVLIDVYDWNTYCVRDKWGKVHRVKAPKTVPAYEAFGEVLLLNFIGASEGREPVICDAASSLPVIEILDSIYRFAGRYPLTVGAV